MNALNQVLTIPELGRVELAECPRPKPGPGEVLLRTRLTVISAGTELTLVGGSAALGSVWSRFVPPIASIGYSHVGDVIEVGPGVDAAWVGCRVASRAPHARYATIAVKASAMWRDGITVIPDRVGDGSAALASLAAITMNGLRRGSLTWGESVAVIGLGLVGQLCTRLCHLAGARPIFAVARSSSRERWLRGAQAISGTTAERQAAIRARSGDRLADIVFETSGDPVTIRDGLELLRPQGRLVVLGSQRGSSTLDFHDLCNWTSATIIGAHVRAHPPPGDPERPWTAVRHVELFLGAVAAGDLIADDLVSHVLPVERAADAYALLRDRTEPVMGVALAWT